MSREYTVTCFVTKKLSTILNKFSAHIQYLSKLIAAYLTSDFKNPKRNTDSTVTFRNMMVSVQGKAQKFSEYYQKRSVILTKRWTG